jgi:hypothetical protein
MDPLSLATGGGGFSGSSGVSGNDKLSTDTSATNKFGGNQGITFGGASTKTGMLVMGAVAIAAVFAVYLVFKKK